MAFIQDRPLVFYIYRYNHARRLSLQKKLLYLGPSRSSIGYFKPLLGPSGRFASETRNAISEAKRLLRNRFGTETFIFISVA